MNEFEQIVGQFRKHENDSGSVEVQIARLTERIQELGEHFEKNPQDFSSKRGLLKMVSKRRKFLKYIERTSPERYKQLIDKLSIRK